jgi:DNA replication regulator DPB11
VGSKAITTTRYRFLQPSANEKLRKIPLAIDISPHFSAKCTHLLCPSREGPKFQKAVEWDIPVVDFDWIKGLATSDSKANQSGNAKGDHVVDPTAMSPAATLDSLRVENSMRRLNLEADGQRQDSDSPLPPNLHPGSESGTSASFPSPRALLGKKRESGGSDTSKGSAGSNQSSDGKSGHINTTALTEELSSTETLTGPENQVQTRTPIRKLPTQRIASSASPSPLKLHPTMSPNPIEQKIRKQASNASPASTGGIAAATTTTTKTPAAIPSTVTASMLAFESASAKALSRNIGAILGSKRPIEDDQDADNNSVSSANEGPRKRPRRPQAKGKGLTPRKLGLMTSIPSFGNENQNQNREDSSTREGSNAPQLLLEPNTAPKGIGVLYDDPIAREEHRRLLHLLNGGEASPPPSTATTTASGRSRSGRKSKGNMNLGQ